MSARTGSRSTLLVMALLLFGCRTTAVLSRPQAGPSEELRSAILDVANARLDAAEAVARARERVAPADAALIRLYLAERHHDVDAVRALASGSTGALLRSDRARLTALARVRYWTEGLQAARDDLRAACGAGGEPDLGIARTNACALATQADAMRGAANTVAPTPGEVRLLPNQPVLVARIAVNGGKPAAFVIDTGAPTTVLARKYADKLHQSWLQVSESSTDGGGNPVVLSPAVVDVLHLGEASTSNAAVHVLDLPPSFHVAGILAPQQAFRGAAVEFDLRARVLRVLPGVTPASWSAIVGEKTHTVPVLWVDGNLYIPARIGTLQTWILFDTGADRNYVCRDIADRLGEGAVVATQEKKKSFTAAGTVEVQDGFEAEFAVGGSASLRAQFMVKPCDRQLRWANLIPPLFGAGYLGVSWLEGRRVLLSGDGRSLVFTEPAKSKPDATPNS